MTKEDRDFIRKYCEAYNVELIPGPGAPCLNGTALTGEALRQLFMPAEPPVQLFYSLGKIEVSKKRKSKETPSGKAMSISYGNTHRESGRWNNFLKMDKLVS